MAFDLTKVRRGVHLTPPRMTVYGTHGVGKTSFAAGAPNPLLLQFEDGEGLIDIAREPVKDYGKLMEVIGALVSEQHQFETVVGDTIDWLEPMVWEEACRRNGWHDIETPGFGKGYLAADDVWREVLSGFDALRDRGMQVILLAHSEVKNFADPTVENYDRHQIKLQKRSWGLVQEWSDIVAFLNFRVVVEKTDAGFNKKIAKGKGFGERILYTEERPAYYAKNRYRLPPEIEMPANNPDGMYQAFAAALNNSVAEVANKESNQ